MARNFMGSSWSGLNRFGLPRRRSAASAGVPAVENAAKTRAERALERMAATDSNGGYYPAKPPETETVSDVPTMDAAAESEKHRARFGLNGTTYVPADTGRNYDPTAPSSCAVALALGRMRTNLAIPRRRPGAKKESAARQMDPMTLEFLRRKGWDEDERIMREYLEKGERYPACEFAFGLDLAFLRVMLADPNADFGAFSDGRDSIEHYCSQVVMEIMDAEILDPDDPPEPLRVLVEEFPKIFSALLGNAEILSSLEKNPERIERYSGWYASVLEAYEAETGVDLEQDGGDDGRDGLEESYGDLRRRLDELRTRFFPVRIG